VRFVYQLSSTDQTSPDMEMPMWVVYLAIPCGSYLMSFRFLQVAWGFFRTGELPHHDAAHVEGVAEAEAVVPVSAPLGVAR
jgi:C4-dicarboxylate transporter DctQ subunit